MDVAKLDVVDMEENPLATLAAEGEPVVGRTVSDMGVLALAVSRLITRFSFYKLKISR